jgi:hypothetical protein
MVRDPLNARSFFLGFPHETLQVSLPRRFQTKMNVANSFYLSVSMGTVLALTPGTELIGSDFSSDDLT